MGRARGRRARDRRRNDSDDDDGTKYDQPCSFSSFSDAELMQ